MTSASVERKDKESSKQIIRTDVNSDKMKSKKGRGRGRAGRSGDRWMVLVIVNKDNEVDKVRANMRKLEILGMKGKREWDVWNGR